MAGLPVLGPPVRQGWNAGLDCAHPCPIIRLTRQADHETLSPVPAYRSADSGVFTAVSQLSAAIQLMAAATTQPRASACSTVDPGLGKRRDQRYDGCEPVVRHGPRRRYQMGRTVRWELSSVPGPRSGYSSGPFPSLPPPGPAGLIDLTAAWGSGCACVYPNIGGRNDKGACQH
jgi:hypothetical protein